MTQEKVVGQVTALWRFPVKSMRGEQLGHSPVALAGLPGDRALALIDEETGEVVSAEKFRRYPGMFGFRAWFPAGAGGSASDVMIELPDGREIRADSTEVNDLVSERLGRAVRLAESRQTTSDGAQFHDAAPVSVLSNSTLKRLGELQPDSIFDARRFRMNLILDCPEPGFPENDWVGRTLRIGSDTRLFITKPDARCVMTTMAQDELPEDRGILTGLARHNRLKVGEKGTYPCAGVYARVVEPGEARLGDAVVLEAD